VRPWQFHLFRILWPAVCAAASVWFVLTFTR
jgi:hypothetical protein